VLNDDWIAGGGGFPPHSHANMEIITIPFSGALSHKDSSGGEGTVRPGQVQLMSAGTGITHSEYNASSTEPVTLFQIWIEPNQLNVKPRYEERDFEFSSITDSCRTFITPDGRDRSMQINQNAYLSWINVSQDNSVDYLLHAQENGIIAIVINGEISIAGQMMADRDSIEIPNPNKDIHLEAQSTSNVLVIEVPVTN
jgi:redox-sensitive bicupin YhaK (pirin superfamily)